MASGHVKRKRWGGKQSTRGYGFVGRWHDGTLGWAMPRHIASVGPHEPPPCEPWTQGETFVLCEITVRQVFDAKGRPIARKVRAKE